MKKRIWVVASFYLMLVSLEALGQTVTKTVAGSIAGSTCPGNGIEYQVSVPTGFGGCQIVWSAINGFASPNQSDKTKVAVIWSDIPGAKGKVTATFSGCGNGNDGKTASLEELILSVKDQAWGAYAGTIDVDYCTRAQVNLFVPHMYVQGTDDINQHCGKLMAAY